MLNLIRNYKLPNNKNMSHSSRKKTIKKLSGSKPYFYTKVQLIYQPRELNTKISIIKHCYQFCGNINSTVAHD